MIQYPTDKPVTAPSTVTLATAGLLDSYVVPNTLAVMSRVAPSLNVPVVVSGKDCPTFR
jgi:hypothetical protein